jgi:hypothetical protein
MPRRGSLKGEQHGPRNPAFVCFVNLLQLRSIEPPEHLSEAQLRAYRLADNKLAEKVGWDREALAVELEELQVLLPEVDLDLTITGFDPDEVDALLLDVAEDRANPADDIPELTRGPAVARTGDLFVLDKHRLAVGDAREPDTFERLMRGEFAEMGFLDPPFNVRIAGYVGGRGRIGGDVNRGVHGFPEANTRSMHPLLDRRQYPLRLHGLAARKGTARSWRRRLQ